ncbi:MAG TPA: hypothetical protein VI999_04775 [Thermoplasmata archaeon]|nr:hypothetical protein [Thermoplasmata archaeon]
MEPSGGTSRKPPGYVRSVLGEIGRTLTHPPNIRSSDRRIFAFLVIVFVVVFTLLGVTFYLFASQLRAPEPSRIGFSTPVMSAGNATFRVDRVDGGPYAALGFSINLTVNNFAGPPIPLPSSNATASIPIGNLVYRATWTDVDRDGTVSMGDAFALTGSGAPLPSLSYFAFRLVWQGDWSAAVFWTTSSE